MLPPDEALAGDSTGRQRIWSGRGAICNPLVVDATVFLEYLLGGSNAGVPRFFDPRHDPKYFVPDYCVMEIVDLIWRYRSERNLPSKEVQGVLRDLERIEFVPFDTRVLLADCLGVCFQLTYDVPYVILARNCRIPLCTLDEGQAARAKQAGVRVLVPGTREAEAWP